MFAPRQEVGGCSGYTWEPSGHGGLPGAATVSLRRRAALVLLAAFSSPDCPPTLPAREQAGF